MLNRGLTMSGSSASFLEAVDNLLGTGGIRSEYSPSSLVGIWEGLVQECEGGYQWDLSEYDNDISCRDHLGEILANLAHYPECQDLGTEVSRVDDRFRAMCATGVERPWPEDHWWRKKVLAKAGEEYRRDVESLYGLEVALWSD